MSRYENATASFRTALFSTFACRMCASVSQEVSHKAHMEEEVETIKMHVTRIE